MLITTTNSDKEYITIRYILFSLKLSTAHRLICKSKVTQRQLFTEMGHLKRYLYIILVIGLLVVSETISAQMKSGFRFGTNLTTMTIQNNGTFLNAETPVGVHFGAYYEMPFNRNISMLYGFLFSSKGTDYKIDTIDISLAPTYIEIPVNFACNFGAKDVRMSLFAGPYAACTIGGYKIVEDKGYKYLAFGSGSNNDLKYFDFGFNLGIGVNIKGYLISGQYGIGLRNISPSEDTKIKNRVIGISVSALGK
jgi:hypothetical protein